jgi:hypothetical protein
MLHRHITARIKSPPHAPNDLIQPFEITEPALLLYLSRPRTRPVISSCRSINDTKVVKSLTSG